MEKSKWDILPRGFRLIPRTKRSRNYDVTLFLGINSNWDITPAYHLCIKIKHRSMAHINLSHIRRFK